MMQRPNCIGRKFGPSIWSTCGARTSARMEDPTHGVDAQHRARGGGRASGIGSEHPIRCRSLADAGGQASPSVHPRPRLPVGWGAGPVTAEPRSKSRYVAQIPSIRHTLNQPWACPRRTGPRGSSTGARYLASAEQRYKAEVCPCLDCRFASNRFSSPPTSNTETTSRSSLLVSTCSMGPWASSTNSTLRCRTDEGHQQGDGDDARPPDLRGALQASQETEGTDLPHGHTATRWLVSERGEPEAVLDETVPVMHGLVRSLVQ